MYTKVGKCMKYLHKNIEFVALIYRPHMLEHVETAIDEHVKCANFNILRNIPNTKVESKFLVGAPKTPHCNPNVTKF